MSAIPSTNETKTQLPSPSLLVAYKREILAVVAVVVLAAVAYSWASSRQTAADRLAASDLFHARRKAMEMVGNPEGQKAQFADVRQKHAGARVVWEAYAFEFGADRLANDPAAAIATGRDFLKANPNHPSAPYFALGTAKLLAKRGDYDEAVKLLDTPSYQTTPELAPERLLLHAQIQERRADEARGAGNAEAERAALTRAEQYYQELVTRGTDLDWPRGMMEIAEFARVLVRDRLEGRVHAEPVVPAADVAVTPAEFGPQPTTLDVIVPPTATDANVTTGIATEPPAIVPAATPEPAPAATEPAAPAAPDATPAT